MSDSVLAPIPLGVVVINIGYLALMVGAFSSSLIRVRVLLVLGSACFVVYGVTNGIGSMALWNLAIGGLNLRRLSVAVGLARSEGRSPANAVDRAASGLRRLVPSAAVGVFGRSRPAVGLTVSDVFVAVSVRADPVRVTGVYRQQLPEIGSPDRLAAVRHAAAEARRVLRAPPGTSTVVALPPVDDQLSIPLAVDGPRMPVGVAPEYDLMAELEGAGFSVARPDALPIAMARFALRSTAHQGRIRAAGWSVAASARVLEASIDLRPRWSLDRDDRTGGRMQLIGVELPPPVARHLRSDLDAGAIGAALRALGFGPDPEVEPLDTRIALRSTACGYAQPGLSGGEHLPVGVRPGR